LALATDSNQANKRHIVQDVDATVSGHDLRHQSYIDNNIDGTWRVDFKEPISLDLPAAEQVDLLYRHGYFGDANQALANQYGFETPADIVGFRLEDFMPRDLPNSIPLLIRLIEENYTSHEWESVERDRYGNRKYFLNNCAGEIADGKLICVWGTAKDITREKQLEDVAHLHTAIFEQIPDGCVVVDASSEQVIYINPAFTRITGYTASDIPDNKLSFLQGDGTNPDTVSEIREAIAYEQSFLGEIVSYKRDGTPFWNMMRILPIKNAKGKFTHYACIITDQTDHKRTQKVLHDQRVQLTHAARVAAMGELTAALSHELNQPLTAILSNAQAAQRFLENDDPDIDEIRAILKDIVMDNKRGGEVIYRIRNLVKRDNCQFEMLDINKVVNQTLALVRNELTLQSINVSTRLAADLPSLHGDAVQLQQVLLNLLINASHALQELDLGERRIMITTQNRDNQTIEITVSDSGPGIDEEQLDLIFQPFITTREEGMGRGLAINRTIIEAHGGRLWAESSPGQDTSFRMTLPWRNEDKRI